ncbi:MAG: class I fructose-bisphosphate aldolase [Alphaproteobacteria bacterium]|nr:class I fructose-bisphosphate aldolase [Alphaproteobacteria bacterium]
MMQKIDNILKAYEGETIGLKANLYKILNHGALAGTGKMIILATDQGFEHGPDKMFSSNLPAYDPHYFYHLAYTYGLNGLAAPLGVIESGCETYLGKLPTILKLNSSNNLIQKDKSPDQAITASVKDAVRLGCTAIGFTIYPGSDSFLDQLEELRDITSQGRAYGLPTIVWAYARGGALLKEAETALDVISYGAHMACLAGAHIVKVKLPTDYLALKSAKEPFLASQIPYKSLTERVAHIVRSCFTGRRMVIFSGGETKNDDAFLNEITAIKDGHGFGSIVGRNFFQRKEEDAAKIISAIQKIYLS